MPIVRLTAFFRDDDGHGWSEAHDTDGGAGTPALDAILTTFDSIMESKRAPMLARDGYYLGCRASYRTGDGRNAGSNIVRDPAVAGSQVQGSVKLWMNQSANAVKMRIQNAARTANSDIYLRGVWDDVFVAGQLDFSTAVGAQWKAYALAYFDALKLSYGWVGINPATTSRGNVSTYAVNPEGTVTFTIAATNAVPPPVSIKARPVRFARINRGKSILNRSFICEVTSPTSATTREIVNPSEFVSAGTYVVPDTAFIPYSVLAYMKNCSRKTGRVFGVGRGRSSAATLH